MPVVHRRSCNLCEAICGILVEVEGARVLSIKGDTDDPLSRGYICPKATALQDLYEDPDRLVRPLRRRGRDFEEVSWDEAFDEAATRIRDMQRKHGRSAVALYQGNPSVHSLGAMTFGQLFTRALQTRSKFSATSADQLPHMLASLLMFGHQLFIPVPDLDRAKLLVILGANPLASNGSIMTAPGMKRRLQAIQARGGRVVVIDPRRTETAAVADAHHFVRPGTDAVLLFALVRALLADPRASVGRLAAFTDGVDALRAVAEPFTLERAAATTGIAAADIGALARSLVETAPAAVYGRFGACTTEFGGLTGWLLHVVNILTGNLDREGGMMFARPAVDLVGLSTRLGDRGHFARGRSRVRGLPEFGGEYPVAVLAEEIDTPGDGQIKGLVTAAGNPVLSTPQGSRLEQALPNLELMISVDMYVNETTRHAHLILPPTAALERDHYDVIFHALAVRNTARWSNAVFPRPPSARHDWEIFLGLASRLAPRSPAARIAARLATRAVQATRAPRHLVDALLRTGPYGLSVAKLEAHPSGLDLGPLTACLPQALQTRDRRIQLAPAVFLEDVPRLVASMAPSSDAPAGLLLIGRRDLRSNNSWMHNSERLVKGPVRCTLLMHEHDAAARGLAHGQRVALTSRTGAVQLPLEVSNTIAPGVVSMPHGWGHTRDGVRLRVAREHAGVSINDVTDAARVDPLSGNASFSATPVEVSAIAEDGTGGLPEGAPA